MAETVWISTTGDGSAAASWDNGVPTTGKTAVFTSASQCDWVTGMTITGTTRIITKPDNYSNLGGPGNPLVGTFTDANNVFRGHGEVHLKMTANGYANCIVDSVNVNALTLDAAPGVVAWRIVAVKRGGLTVLSNARVIELVTVGMTTARATIEVGADPTGVDFPNHIHVRGGKVVNKRYTGIITDRDIVVSGGELRQTGVLGQLAAIKVDGGRFTYVPATTPDGSDLPDLYVYGGVADFSEYGKGLTFARLVIGPGATILGTIVESPNSVADVDLREDYP